MPTLLRHYKRITYLFYIYIINQQIHLYKNVQSHIIVILHQRDSITPVTIIRVSYNEHTININIIIQKYIIKTT